MVGSIYQIALKSKNVHWFNIVLKPHHATAPSACTHISWTLLVNTLSEGAQWLSGIVLDSRLKGSGFEPHRRHCVVVLEQDTFILA